MPAPRSKPAGDGPRTALRLILGLAIACVMLLAELRLGDTGDLRSLELQTLDWRFRWRGPLIPGSEVVLVAADDRTVAELGAWPVPRAAVAEAIRRLTAAGARVIGLDLLFAEPEQALPAEVRSLIRELSTLSALPEDLRHRAAALAAGGSDRELAQAMAAAERVVTPYAFVFRPAEANRRDVPPAIRAAAYRIRTEAEGAAAPTPTGLLVPAEELLAAGRGTGHVTLVLEPDGSLRAALPAIPYQGELYPSLPVEILRLYLGLGRDRLAYEAGTMLRLGDLRVPLDPAGRQLVSHYGPSSTLSTVSLLDLLQGSLDPSRFADRIVLIGASAAGAGDRFATPFSARLPGMEFLGTAIDNMLHDRSLIRNEATRALDALVIVVMAVATACLAGRRSPMVSAGAILALLAGWAVLIQLAFTTASWWLAGVTPALAAILAGMGVETLRLAQERSRRRGLERQRANLGRYFAPAVVERLALSDRPYALDRTHEATVMFVDLMGFTRTVETLSPAEAMALLRTFHTLVEGIVFAHQGMVDKFMGDGVMACFGVPDPMPTAAADALRTAFDLLAALGRPLPAGEGRELHLKVGIGIHRGPVLMGDVGGAKQLQFTVVGDAVNVASRLEALTRSVGTYLIASDAVVEAARGQLEPALLARLEPLSAMQLRGRVEPIRIWRLAEAA